MATPFEIPFDQAVLRGEAGGFGLPVVFLHAGVADRRMWRSQMEKLASAGYHVIAYDRRGFGETTSPNEPFNHLIDLEAVLDRLSINAAVLVGCSMGGGLAIDFALHNPDRTVALVLVGTGVSGAPEAEIPEPVQRIERELAAALEEGDLDSANELLAWMWLDGPLSEEGRVEGEVRDLFLEMNHLALEKRGGLTREEPSDPAFDSLGEISVPTLVLVGERDEPCTVELAEMVAATIENAFAETIEDTAHLIPLERPDLFDPLLLQFLEALTGEAEA